MPMAAFHPRAALRGVQCQRGMLSASERRDSVNSTVAGWVTAPSLSQALADTTLSIDGVRRPSLDQDFISAGSCYGG